MQSFKQYLLSASAAALNSGWLIKTIRQPVIHPFYHTVSDVYLPHIHPLYAPKTKQAFEKDIDFLLKNYHPVNIEEVFLHAKKEKIITEPAFHLSFDDGLREVYEVVFPILARKGIPFTVFINTDFVDNRDLFYRYKAALIVDKLNNSSIKSNVLREIKQIFFSEKSGSIQKNILAVNYLHRNFLDKIAAMLEIDFHDFLSKQKPYLFTEEIMKMQRSGVTVGAHSIDHPRFALLPEREMIRQTIDSCVFVRQIFHEQHAYFAFPFSDEEVADTYFSIIFDSVDLTFGISGINTKFNERHIARIDMEQYGKSAKECVKKACLAGIIKKRWNL